METWKEKPFRMRYPTTELKRLQWRVKDIDDIPPGFTREPIHSAQDLMKYWFLFKDMPSERFVVFVLNTANRIVSVDIVSEGTMNASLVHPREVFRAAVMGLGAAIIVAHNHPSGNIEPSSEDCSITRQITEAGKILGIPVHDHIIFGENGYTSFAERGIL